ncbi:PGN_0703 family putative restriction endonuclease [Maricaulaceae bacterium MS644]
MKQESISERPTKFRVIRALSEAFSRQHPDIALDLNGYAADFHGTLLPGVSPEDFEGDLSSGDGNELETKFRAAHSSSGLAVNCFAPFRQRIADLTMPGHSGFDTLQFERKCPTGLRGGRAPNLDVVLSGPNSVLAIESKLTEYLSAHRADFSPAYEAQIRDARRDQGYFREMLRLQDRPDHYTWLDAAQLIKHSFGLARSFPDRPVTLLYLFWEPANPNAGPEFAAHRDEIDEFRARVEGSSPAFEAMSYPELWQSWRDSAPTPGWLNEHLENLQGRYLVSI